MQENKNPKVTSGRLVAIWGNDILDDGFTTIPNMIIRYAKKAGLTGSECHLINLILTFKHDVNDPYPSQETLADLYGTTRQNIGNMLTRIFEKGLIDIYENFNEKGQFQNNVYSLGPLVAKCLELAKKDREKEEKGTLRKRKRVKESMPQNSGMEGQLFSGMEGQLFSGTKKNNKKDKEKNEKKKTLSQELPFELKSFLDSDFFKEREREISGLQISDVLKRYDVLKEKVSVTEFVATLEHILLNFDEIKTFSSLFQTVLEKNVRSSKSKKDKVDKTSLSAEESRRNLMLGKTEDSELNQTIEITAEERAARKKKMLELLES